MSTWAHFRRIWLKPEVYPLIGAMGAAIGICGYQIYNKTRDSIITWDRSKRSNSNYFSTVDEYVPAGHSTSKLSARIFGSENVVYESHSLAHAEQPQTFTIRIGDDEEEEEEEEEQAAEPEAEAEAGEEAGEEAEAEAESAGAVEAVATEVNVTESVEKVEVVVEPLALKDESVDKIQAALDAALNLTDTTTSSVDAPAEPSPSAAA